MAGCIADATDDALRINAIHDLAEVIIPRLAAFALVSAAAIVLSLL